MFLIIILLVSSTSIGFYLYQVEKHWRKNLQGDLDASRATEAKLQGQIKDLQAQLNLALDKNKEADRKINSLLEEKDLNESLRAALKKENVKLKEDIEIINTTKENLRTQLDKSNDQLSQSQELLKTAKSKITQVEQRANEIQQRVNQAQEKADQLEKIKKALEDKIEELTASANEPQKTPRDPESASQTQPADTNGPNKGQLDKIVVNAKGPKGHILSIDADAGFVIFNLGSKQGIKSKDILAVYRGDQYLGDIQTARVQEALSAADLIPPLTAHEIHRDDTVVLKP